MWEVRWCTNYENINRDTLAPTVALPQYVIVNEMHEGRIPCATLHKKKQWLYFIFPRMNCVEMHSPISWCQNGGAQAWKPNCARSMANHLILNHLTYMPATSYAWLGRNVSAAAHLCLWILMTLDMTGELSPPNNEQYKSLRLTAFLGSVPSEFKQLRFNTTTC